MSKKDRGKTPVVAALRPAGLAAKVPVASAAPPGGWNTVRPSLHLAQMDMGGPFSWANISDADARMSACFLREISSNTWAEILGGKHHAVDVEDIVKEARARLGKLELDDLDNIVSLRLGGKQRIWVARFQHYAFLLWWDPEHAVCPSTKKNT